MAPITLNENTLDPTLAHAGFSQDASKTEYILIQLHNVLSAENIMALKASDVALHEFVGNDTYLCQYKHGDLVALQNKLSFINSAVVYNQKLVISQDLKQQLGLNEDGVAVNAQGQILQGSQGDKVAVAIILHRDPKTGLHQILESTKKLAGTEVLDAYAHVIRARVHKGNLSEIASWDSVRTIEKLPTVSLQSNVARQIMRVEDVQKRSQPGRFRGDGEVIAIVDSGLDTGDKVDINTTNAAFKDRVVDIINYNRETEIPKDSEGHGTHVAGCAVGVSIPYQPTGIYEGSHEGPRPENIQGAACEAKIFAIAFDYSNEVPNLLDIFSRKYYDGHKEQTARISNNSWVSTSARSIVKIQQPYGEALGKLVDQAMWDDKQLLVCFAAGNNGKTVTDQGAQIGGVSAAKNCITVGATLNERMMVYDDTSFTRKEFDSQSSKNASNLPQPYMGKRNNVASFSNRGPTLKGRVKPDVVAPGGVILGARSRAMVSVDGNGAIDDRRFFFASGTSMSTPFVSGCAAILREALVKTNVKEKDYAPSGALLKALLIHGAVDIAQGRVLIEGKSCDIPAAPNGIQGFGLVDLEASLQPILDPNPGYIDGIVSWDDQIYNQSLINSNDSGELTTTLVWTDYPGEELQSYLQLQVELFKDKSPKKLDGKGNPMPDDTRTTRVGILNNVQKVVWKGIGKGLMKIQVFYQKPLVLLDKIEAQPFALIWTLC